MVVIVIMGILAAVAVPKLFGMIAKSKASEVPTAAGTWINLQDAYTVESNAVGTWTQIGYNAPGTKDDASSAHTTNFGYADGKSGNAETWTATAKVKLNDCDVGGTWVATATPETKDASEGGMTYVQIGTSGTPNCTGLTPSFANLARTTAQ
jgi:type II secretory pathway pseudopilin PulG